MCIRDSVAIRAARKAQPILSKALKARAFAADEQHIARIAFKDQVAADVVNIQLQRRVNRHAQDK
jgi:hypothetical protein